MIFILYWIHGLYLNSVKWMLKSKRNAHVFAVLYWFNLSVSGSLEKTACVEHILSLKSIQHYLVTFMFMLFIFIYVKLCHKRCMLTLLKFEQVSLLVKNSFCTIDYLFIYIFIYYLIPIFKYLLGRWLVAPWQVLWSPTAAL